MKLFQNLFPLHVVVDWIVQENTILNTQSTSVAKAFKACGISNALDGSDNRLMWCAKELPHFHIPYGESTEKSHEDIFANTDEEEEFSDEESEQNLDDGKVNEDDGQDEDSDE